MTDLEAQSSADPANSDPAPVYLLDNRAEEAEQRFDSLSAMFDPVTIRHLTAIGVGSGWRCWEVGVGGPSILTWLAGQVGPTGRVLATDIDTRWAQPAASANVEVRRHDVAEDPPPAGPFDVVHARLVLIHVPDAYLSIALPAAVELEKANVQQVRDALVSGG